MHKALSHARESALDHDYAVAEIEYLKVLKLNPHQPQALAGLGGVYYDEGKWSVAVPVLMEAVQVAPNNLDVRMKAASLYLKAGMLDEAREHADFILSHQPTNAEAVLVFAEAAVLSGKSEDAGNRLQTIGEGAGDLAAFDCADAIFLINRGDYANAAQEARSAIEKAPDFDAGYALLGDALLRLGKEAEGRESLHKAYELGDNRSFRKFRWIDFLMSKGEADQARSLLEELNQETPGYFPVLLRRARLDLAAGELDASGVWLDKAIELDSGSFEALSLRSELLLKQGKTDEAISLLERMVKLAPQSGPLNLQLARAYARAGDNAAALTQLNHTIEMSPGLIEPRLMRIEIALRMGDAPGALIWINELLRVVPDNRAVRIMEAEARRLSGNLDQAGVIYSRLLEKNPKDTEALFRLGQIRFLQNKLPEARGLFEAALESEPGHLPSLSALADMDLKDQNLAAAVERVQGQMALNPNSLGPKFLLSQIYLAQGSQQAAEEELNGVIQLAPTWRPPYLILARLYVDSGQVDSARSQLNQLLSERPNDERAMMMLATLDEVQNDYSAAAERYEEFLKVHPNNVLAMNNLAYLYATHLPNLGRAFTLASAARGLKSGDSSIADTFGWVLIQRREYRRALGILRDQEFNLNKSPESAYHLGLAYYFAGVEPSAEIYLKMAVDNGSEFFGRSDATNKLAVLNVDPVHADDQTVKLLKVALEDNAADPVALGRLAGVYQSKGNRAEERSLYEGALKADPTSVPALIGLARICAESTNEQARAMDLARSARLIAPKDPVVARTLGELAFKAGDHPWALSLFQECSSVWPDQADLLWDLGLAYYSMGRLPEAEQTLRKLLSQAQPGQSKAGQFVELLARQHSLGDAEQARQLADQALQSDPNNPAALMVLGMVSEHSGKPVEALGFYQDVLKKFPNFAPAARCIAVMASDDLKNDSLAYEYGVKAREMFPNDPELSGALGEVMYRRGDYTYANQLLKEALTKQADDVDLLYYFGLSQYQTKDFQLAKQALTRAIAMDASHPLAEQAGQALNAMRE